MKLTQLKIFETEIEQLNKRITRKYFVFFLGRLVRTEHGTWPARA
jgi:hypothetical protein